MEKLYQEDWKAGNSEKLITKQDKNFLANMMGMRNMNMNNLGMMDMGDMRAPQSVLIP